MPSGAEAALPHPKKDRKEGAGRQRVRETERETDRQTYRQKNVVHTVIIVVLT